ncbi:MAG: hypothetical protein HY722_11185 [Planctomycetes bacterium]|nr:hypothetical protein [Planctomycetota bacterium]
MRSALAMALALGPGCARRETRVVAAAGTAGSTSASSTATGPTFTATLTAREPGGAARSVFDAGQTAELAIELLNRTASDQTLVFPTGQTFELVATSGGQVAWRYSAGRAFPQVITRITVPAGGRHELSGSWPMVDARGLPMAAGDYDVEASLVHVAGPAVPALVPVRLTVRAAPAGLSTELALLDSAGLPAASAAAGDPLTARLRVSNRGGAPLKVQVPTATHSWDAWLTDAAGARVWQASATWGAPGAGGSYDLAPGATREFTESLRAPGAAGRYALQGVAAGAPAPAAGSLTVTAPARGLTLGLEVADAAGLPTSSFPLGAPVHVALRVTNTGAAPETLEWGTPLRETIQVQDVAGALVWDPRFGLTITPPPPGFVIRETLQPGRSLVFNAVWDQSRSSTRQAVAPGPYQATGRLNGRAVSGTPIPTATPVPFRIVVAPPPPPAAGFTARLAVLDAVGQPAAAFRTGEAVRVELAITNWSPAPAVLTAPDGCGLAATSIGSGATTVRDAMAGRMCTMALVDVRFAPGETKTFRFDWDQRNDAGQAVAAGPYEARARVRTVFGSASVAAPLPAPFTIGAVPVKPANTLRISGVATNNGIVASRIGFDVGVVGFPKSRVEVTPSARDTPAVTARALAAQLGRSFLGTVTVLPGGDAELRVGPGPLVLLAGPVEVANARSNDPGQSIRVQ